MDVTVTVRLGLDETSALADSQLGRVVDQSWHVLLLDNEDLLLFHAEVVVLLQ